MYALVDWVVRMKALIHINKEQIDNLIQKNEFISLILLEEEAIEIGASRMVIQGKDTFLYKGKVIVLEETRNLSPQTAIPMKKEQIEERLDFCRICEHANSVDDIIMSTCNLCGCSIDMIVTTNYKVCPKGKWGAV